MCRSIKPLFNFDPPATDKEIHAAALQFVRKVSGYHHPSQVNEAVFFAAVDDIARDTKKLLSSLETKAHTKDREAEAQKAKERFERTLP